MNSWKRLRIECGSSFHYLSTFVKYLIFYIDLQKASKVLILISLIAFRSSKLTEWTLSLNIVCKRDKTCFILNQLLQKLSMDNSCFEVISENIYVPSAWQMFARTNGTIPANGWINNEKIGSTMSWFHNCAKHLHVRSFLAAKPSIIFVRATTSPFLTGYGFSLMK